MSITDELRKYAQRYKNSNDAWSGIGDDLDHIADHIDAEHEEAVRERRRSCVYYDPERHYCSYHDFDANGYIELPKDADGVPIHVGDVMESKGSGLLFDKASFEVRAMQYNEGGWEVYDRLGDRYAPSLLRHHHAPTVEDVLTEMFAKAIERGELTNGAAQTIAEYAAKLQLKEDA